MRLALIRLWILLSMPLAVAACAGGTRIVAAPPAPCTSLVPEAWQDGVEGAPLPGGRTVGDWVVFGDAQTGKLDQANGRTRDAIGIVRRCEERDRAAVKQATRRRFLGVF